MGIEQRKLIPYAGFKIERRGRPPKKFVVTSVSDIPRLPWRGSFADDEKLFIAVDNYIKREPDLGKRQRANYLASIIGMGEDIFTMRDTTGYDPKEGLVK